MKIVLTKRQIEQVLSQYGKGLEQTKLGKEIIRLRDKRKLNWNEIGDKLGLNYSYCWQLYRRCKKK